MVIIKQLLTKGILYINYSFLSKIVAVNSEVIGKVHITDTTFVIPVKNSCILQNFLILQGINVYWGILGFLFYLDLQIHNLKIWLS